MPTRAVSQYLIVLTLLLTLLIGACVAPPTALPPTIAPTATLTTSQTTQLPPAGGSWTTKAAMPTARGNLAVAVANGKLYAIGGVHDAAFKPLATVEEFDPGVTK